MALDNLRVLPIALCLMASADSNAQTTAAAGAIAGGVFVLNPDGVAYIPGAKIILQGPETLQTETDDSGQYSFHKVQPGNYTIEARFPNLEAIQEVMIPSGAVTKLNLELKPVAVTTSVTVADTEKAPTNPETITAKTVANAPNVKERFRSLLPLLPGVVRGPDGRINMKGARNTQSGALVNGANLTNPATGEPGHQPADRRGFLSAGYLQSLRSSVREAHGSCFQHRDKDRQLRKPSLQHPKHSSAPARPRRQYRRDRSSYPADDLHGPPGQRQGRHYPISRIPICGDAGQ